MDINTPLAAVKKPEQPLTGVQSTVDKKQEIENFLECIARYNQYGKALKRATTMQEVGGQLAQIAELAEAAVVNEAEDWFDAHTLKRNMKEIKTYAGDFVKLATEADMINQRMTALYDDMGRILERYFEIPDEEEGDPERAATSDDTVTMNSPSRDVANPPVKEDYSDETTLQNGDGVVEDMLITKYQDAQHNPTEPALPSREEMGKTPVVDRLTLRAIVAVYKRLKMTNPAMAAKFAKLPPQKMEDVVWRLVK